MIKKDIQAPAKAEAFSIENLVALRQMEEIVGRNKAIREVTQGHKFGVPDLPIPSKSNLHFRYDTVVDQVTNLMMEHGKLSKAQRVGSSVPL